MSRPEKTPLEQLLEDLDVERYTPAPPKPGSPRAIAREPMSAKALGEFLEEIDVGWTSLDEAGEIQKGGRLRVVAVDPAVGE